MREQGAGESVTTFASDVTIPEGDAGRRRRLGVLLICSSSLFIVYLDSTILNVALPTLQRDLHASLSGLQWVADAYLLVVSSLLLLSGSAADRLGRKRVFLIGLAGFGLGSLLCSLAPDTGWLIGLRMLQGIGGAVVPPVSPSVVPHTVPRPEGTGARHRNLVGDLRRRDGLRPDRRRRAGLHHRLAVHLLAQRADLRRHVRRHGALRARVAGAAAPPGRRARPVAA